MTVARADSPVGEVVLRRRGEVVELVVGGVFVMDTVDVSTEVQLATLALARHESPRRVLVGGLGLGFTAAAVLADRRVEDVVVAEIAGPLVEWAHAGMLPAELQDPRLTLRTADVGASLAEARGAWDLVLLDVDNGPGFLVRGENAELYARAGLAAALAALRPGGVLAIWSSHRAPELAEGLRALGAAGVTEVLRQVHREGRELDYAIYLGRRDGAGRVDLSPPHTGE